MHDEWWNQPSHGLTYGERLVKLEAQVTAAISRGREEAERIGLVTRRVQDHGHYLTDHGRHLAYHDQRMQRIDTKMEQLDEQRLRKELEDRAAADRVEYRKQAIRFMAMIILGIGLLLKLFGQINDSLLGSLISLVGSALGLGK